MSVTLRELTAQAELTVSVSRHAPGDLEAGVRRQLERIDGVRVEALEMRGLQPGLNDLTVRASARLSLRSVDEPDAGDVAERLSSGFGVSCRAVELTERVPPD